MLLTIPLGQIKGRKYVTDNTTGSDQRKKVCYWQYHWVRSKEESMLLTIPLGQIKGRKYITDNTTGSDQRKKVCYWQYHWVRSKEESMLLITSTPINMVMVPILTSSLKLKCKFYYFISNIHITSMRTCSAYVILILRM
jgi:hypothetical protein